MTFICKQYYFKVGCESCCGEKFHTKNIVFHFLFQNCLLITSIQGKLVAKTLFLKKGTNPMLGIWTN